MKRSTTNSVARMCFALPAKLHRGLKLRAVMNGESIQGLIIKAIEQTYPEVARASKKVQDTENAHD